MTTANVIYRVFRLEAGLETGTIAARSFQISPRRSGFSWGTGQLRHCHGSVRRTSLRNRTGNRIRPTAHVSMPSNQLLEEGPYCSARTTETIRLMKSSFESV